MCDRGVGVERTLENHLLHVTREQANHKEQISIFGFRGNEKFRRRGTGDLDLLLERSGEKGDPITKRLVGDIFRYGSRLRTEAMTLRVKIKFCPLGARERPFVLGPLNELFAHMPNLELDGRLLLPTCVLSFEKVAEKFLLKFHPVAGIKMGPMLKAMDLKPLFLRRGAHEPFDVPAQMKSMPAPISRREKGHFDFGPIRAALLPELTFHGMREKLFCEVGAVPSQFFFR